MAKKISKDLKEIKIVIPKENPGDPETFLIEEKKDLTDEIEIEDSENVIRHDPNNTLENTTFNRRRLKEANMDVNPSLELNPVNLEQAVINIPRNIEDNKNRNPNPLSNSYISQDANQNNVYAANANNLYGSNENTNQAAYTEVTGVARVTTLEQQRLNQTSINAPQTFIQNPQTEMPKTNDPWGFDSMGKNITNIEEARKREKEKRFYQ